MRRSRTHRWASAWRSLPLRLAAIGTSVAVVAALAVSVSPAVAAAGDPVISGVPLAQHVQVTPWSVSGTTATSPYPGNMSPFGPITVDASAQALVDYSDSSLQMRPLVVPSGCLGSNTAVGYTTECETHTTTLTFPHAVINPVIALATGVQTDVAPSTKCAAQWQDVSFASINGAAPATSQVSPQRAVDPRMTWANNRLSYLPSESQAQPCVSVPSPYAFFRVGGLISSVTLTLHTMMTITYNPSNVTFPPSPGSVSRGVHMFLWLPASDLSVAKTGPSTVEAGGQISWQIRVTNASGSSPSHGFVVHDVVPAGVTNVSITSGQPECSLSGNDLVCARAPAGWTVAENGTVSTVADLSGGNSSALIPSILNAGATYGPVVLTGTAPTAPGATLTNGATVSGVDVDENITNNTNEVTTTITDAPSLSLVKSASSGGAPITTLTLGETIDYSFLVTNTGTVALSGIAIADTNFTGSGTLPAAVCPPGDLAPGASTTCTSSYVVTAADAATGVIDNTAVARGTAPGAPAPTESAPSTAQVPLALGGQITLRKTGALAGGATGVAGDPVHYTFVATNTGGVSLNGVTIADPLPGLSALTYDWPGTPGTLLPTQEVRATATYILTQADVDAGSVVNTATTSGIDPGGATVTANDSATVAVPPAPAITLAKTGGLAAGASGVVGDTVEYSFLASNSGNVTLTGVTIADPLPGMSPLTYDWSGTPGTLLPGESVSATATYVLTQADVDAGSVVNTATATGTDPANTPVSANDTATVPVLQAPGISLIKTGALATGATGVAGDTVEYSFLVSNIGNLTLTGVTVADPLPGLSALTYTWPGTPGTLLPGQEVPATATYVLTAADVAAGSVVNTATATGTDPSNTPVTADDTATVPISSPAIALVKTGTLAAGATGIAGDVVEYAFQATNTGNVTLTAVTIADPLPGLSAVTYNWPGTPGTLLPGQVVPATATYVLTQADVDAGSVVNTATATGTDPDGGTVTGTDTATVGVPQNPGIVLVKTGGLAAGATGAVGDTVEYSFVATNSGNVTLTGVTIADPLPGLSALTYNWPGTPGTLLPNQTVPATATYVLTQADVDAGSVVNAATATGTDPGNGTVTGNDTTTVNVPQNPAIALVKTGGLAAGATGAVGDTVEYTFEATNSGDVTLTGVTIADPLPGLSALTYNWPGAPGTLLPGQVVPATATYVLTQADVDAGSVVNTATATGTDPGNGTVTGNDTTTVDVTPSPAITLLKTGGLAAGSTGAVGDTVDYTFEARNTGDVTLTGVTIADPLPGLSALTYTWPGTPGTLSPGQVVPATATYVLTQADIDAGSVVNTATATGTDPGNVTVTGDDTTTVDVPQNPAIALVKTGGLAAGATGAVGDTVEYTFEATNSGNETLTGVTIVDPLPGLTALTYTWPGTPGTLLPGQVVPATATYVLTQADVDAGSVVNTATATGTDPANGTVTGDDTTTVDVPQNPAIALVKTGGLAAGETGAVGDTVDYTFEARNTGNVTLTGVTIADPLPGLSALTYNWPGTAGTLLPNQTVPATATYVLTQADIDAGSVLNTATATGADPGNGTVTGNDTTTVDIPQNPAITLTKTGGLAAGATGAVGDTIDYTFAATNSGDVTLTGVTIADPLPGLSALTYNWPGTPGTLLPGQAVPATATYVLTQADIDAGSVVNTATATGTDPSNGTVTGDDTTTVSVTPAPAITLAKTGGLAAGATGAVGDTVEYSFVATNSGNVTLTGVTIADPLPGLSALTYNWPGTPGTLLPGQAVPATATYVLTQADIDAGSVLNTATATGTDPGNGTVTGNDTTTVDIPQNPAITLTKTGGLAAGAIGAAGDTVEYTFEARNTGNVTLTGVTISDPLPGLSALTFTWPGTPGTLLPGQAVPATATYLLTQADVDAGSVVNTATATGTDPGNGTVTDDDTTTVSISPVPGIALVKTGGLAAGASGAAGDTITYTFEARNTGNVTLTGVTIADPLPGLSALTYTWPGTSGTLLPNQTVPATATYVLTQADLDAGSVVNTATATGTDPGGEPTTGEDTTTVLVPHNPGITLLKTGGLASGATGAVGDTVEFRFAATNTGNLPLSAVTIDDPMPGLSSLTYDWPGQPGTLAPGQTVRATATYQLTQGDLDRGSVANTATASSTDPSGDPVTDEDTTTVPTHPAPGLSIVKTGGLTAGGVGAAGSTVAYRFTATNTGNVTLTGVTIVDPLPGLSQLSYRWPGTPGTLTPGQSVTATATYVVTRADLSRGRVTNSATVTGDDPTGSSVTATSNTVVIPLGALAKTGTDIWWTLLYAASISLLLIGAGAALWVAQILRRRRNTLE